MKELCVDCVVCHGTAKAFQDQRGQLEACRPIPTRGSRF